MGEGVEEGREEGGEAFKKGEDWWKGGREGIMCILGMIHK